MKDTEIHIGLPEKEIRDFLSSQICEILCPTKRKEHSWPEKDVWVNSLHNAKIDLENAKNEIFRCEKMIGINRILESFGWSEHDCSNFVSRTDKFIWKNFIGTHEEFKNFMKVNFNMDE
jgi:hypothetical protein